MRRNTSQPHGLLRGLHADLQFEPDFREPGSFRMAHQVTVIEIPHGIVSRGWMDS